MRIVAPSVELYFPTPEVLKVFNPEALIERCGRICYKSDITKCDECKGEGEIPAVDESLPLGEDIPVTKCGKCGGSGYIDRKYLGDPDPASAAKFVRRIMKRGHESVIEHAVATLAVVTCRGVTHEKVRHRLGSYSQESTRYCDYDKDKFGNEITVIIPPYHLIPGNEESYTDWAEGMQEDEERYQRQRARGVPPEVAREGLPNALKTEIASTYNFREWRHFFRLRMSKYAHPQIRQIAVMAWSLLSAYVAPTCFNTDEFQELAEAILGDPKIPGCPVETARGERMEWRYRYR
jgi:thymidylate synthase (FAD)